MREGQTKRAPMEQIADYITGHFVPIICVLAILTFAVWFGLGAGGILDPSLKSSDESWASHALSFAIATFVIACPCGIGLAAPTAITVGIGIAAKHQILAKGGGEAFQNASAVDVVVFDKTGTLTMGIEPKVTDSEIIETNEEEAKKYFLMASNLEETTSHPLGKAIVDFCAERKSGGFDTFETEEILGHGMWGSFKDGEDIIEAIIGNEKLMREREVAPWTEEQQHILQKWKSEAKSVVLLAIRMPESCCQSKKEYRLKAMFAVEDPIRPEAALVVKVLREKKFDVWMISGDNPDTAKAVARKVGIKPINVIAGVLPSEKVTIPLDPSHKSSGDTNSENLGRQDQISSTNCP